MDIIDEQVDTVGRAFMGLTLGCARCHDHKFDPVSTRDYYALSGIFKSTKTMENFKVVAQWQDLPLASAAAIESRDKQQQQIDTKQSEIDKVTAAATQAALQEARAHVGQYLLAARQLDQHVELLARAKPFGNDPDVGSRPDAIWVEAEDNYAPIPEFVEQWSAYLRQLDEDGDSPFADWLTAVHSGAAGAPAELARQYQQRCAEISAAARAAGDSPPEGLEDTQNESLRKVLYDPEGPFKSPATIESYYAAETVKRLAVLREHKNSLAESLPQFPQAMGVSEGPAEDLQVHIRGSHLTLGVTVPRGFPAILRTGGETPIGADGSGRLQLARWMTAPEHPLTARVIVNRIWLWHFGAGLVRSPDNFGQLGERPTHPELLDWLTTRFVAAGWSVKKMHRELMLSWTYQMSTTWSEQAAAADPENRLWWRFHRRRLEAEAIRDALLAASGRLDFRMGGSLLPTPNRKYVTNTANVDPVTYQSNRRSLYLPVVRSGVYDVFQAFDFADPSVLSGRRKTTTVAPQALFMLNSQLVSDETAALADVLLARQDLYDAGRVHAVYERALTRSPAEREVARALDFVKQYADQAAAAKHAADEARRRAWQSLCRVILATNEFIYVE